MTRQFHRPARLDPETAENIEGAGDTAVASELSHRAAQALIGGFDGETGPGLDADGAADPLTRDAVARAVGTHGVDQVAELWADAPATTLPGALWRVFLVREWIRRGPEVVERRYATRVDLTGAGVAAVARADRAIAGARSAPSPEAMRAELDAVLAGRCGGVLALAPVLARTAGFLRALASGSDPEWIADDADELAHPVTRRDSALMQTADELDDAARRAAAGSLD